jgi:hypothetical protein
LRDDGFEDFVTNGGEYPLVVVEAEVLMCGLVLFRVDVNVI